MINIEINNNTKTNIEYLDKAEAIWEIRKNRTIGRGATNFEIRHNRVNKNILITTINYVWYGDIKKKTYFYDTESHKNIIINGKCICNLEDVNSIIENYKNQYLNI